MDNLIIEGTGKTPEIRFNTAGTIEIAGKSIPENSIGFYQPLYNWVDEYVRNAAATTEVKISLEYFNTSSSKCLLDILRKLEALHRSGGSKVTVSWYYEADDEDMMEAGQDYNSLVDLTFNIISL
jgi:hypothetical protein